MKFNDTETIKFLSRLQENNIEIYISNNNLKIIDKNDSITEEILSDLKNNKAQILRMIQQNVTDEINIGPMERCIDLPLSFAQERLWFIDQYDHSASYNIPGAVKLIGKFDINVLRKTFLEIIRRHEVLRTNFVSINNVASQLIHQESKFSLKTVDQSHVPEEEANQKILELIEIESQKPFDLANDSLIRLVLYKINDKEHTLFLNKHHIISDGWSFSVFIKEISILYKAFSENKPSPLPELKIQYADYAVWQREHIKGELLIQQSEYWKNKLSGAPILELPADKPRPAGQTFNGANWHFRLDKDISEKLNTFSKENDATLFMILLSVFKVLLNKYTGQDDICVGTPIANRTREEIEPLIGFFVNTLALRSDLSGDISFVDLVKQVKKTTLDAYSNQDMPFEKVVEIVKPERNLSYSPLFQVMMALQNNPASELSFGELSLKHVEFEQTVSKFDLTLNFTETPEGLVGVIEYNTDLFDKGRIERMTGHFNVLVESIISNPTATISELEILTSPEKHTLLVEWNNTEADYPKDKCIHQLFEEQSRKTPENVAVVFENKQLTYTQLNKKANQLAHYLQSKGVKPDTLAGICVDRSLEMIVGLLGIIKAGGAYVPIDPTYPQERISYMLADAECEKVLTQEHLELPQTNSEIIYLDADWNKIENEADENVKSEVKSDNLAYVIYTSGSTGKPKGVCIEHNAIINTLLWRKIYYNLNHKHSLILTSSFAFDSSVEMIWGSLISCCKLIVLPKEQTTDFVYWSKIFRNEENVNLLMIPSLYKIFLENYNGKDDNFNSITIAGESFSKDIVLDHFKKHSCVQIYNEYGPTENSVCSTVYEFNESISNVSIGKPIHNTKLYILDKSQNLLPVGVPGELCISGNGLSRGYLKQPELTAEKFIKNPFSEDSNSRLYKTGDLVRYLSDGNIEFLGRIDNQVKIRGFRIELGEIEATINKIETIKDCVLVAKDDARGNKRLVAYLVSGDEVNIQELRNGLSKSLPDYMVPSLFVSLEKMPLSPNGKIDKKALPDPEVKAGEDYLAPSNEIEETLVEIWGEVLDIDKKEISINKSFFEIGGNSLLSIKLHQKLKQLDEFKHITIPDLFKYHTINMLVQSIQQDKLTEYKLQKKTYTSNHEIAIIGMSGAFSGVSNIVEFWQLIKNQDEGIRFYSKDECEKLGVDAALFGNPDFIPVTSEVKDIELFDPLFWEISPNEAKLIDPQIRKFIEHCWFVLESSGYIRQRKDHNIGVFAGSGSEHYFYSNVLNGEMASQINMWEALLGSSKSALVTKTSYMLGLSGPSNSINTACSTGLVSVVEACKNIQLGTCDMALAGGVSLFMPKQLGHTYQEGMILSKDGHCRTFDQDASGATGGAGVGVILLKRLEDAIKNNDNIIGVIKGYASNNDGDRKTDYTAPSVTGQAECIINAQKMAGVSSGEIDYVECHGTATNLGDPIEVQALREAFEFNSNGFNSKHKTVLGAVKANIGHADSAAGTAGLIKACLMLQNSIIPGQPNFNIPNPKLNIDQTNFEIAKVNKKWLPNSNKQRIAGVSSFGIGGTNVHVIIGDYIPDSQKQPESDASSSPSNKEQGGLVNFIVPISAKCKQSLKLYKQQLIKYLTEANKHSLSIEDIVYTLQERREHFNYRSAYRAKNIDELINNLKLYRSFGQVNTEFKDKIVFMFPGQGAQYPCMAKKLYDNDQFFKNTIDKLISLANQNLDVDLYQVMYPKEGSSEYDINETRWTQISLFIIEYAFAEYLEHLGICADAYIGHSLGEYVAATLSGVFTLEDAIKVVIARSELMQSIQSGSMLAIEAKEETIRGIVKEYNCEISLVNSIDDIVVSGNDKDIKTLKGVLDKKAIPTVKLNISLACHSKMAEQIKGEFESVFKNIKLNKPTKCFISNLNGEIAKEEVSRASYWYRHLRNTVQFAKGLNSISKHYKHQISFIEVGPDEGLSYFINKYKKVNNYKSIKVVKLLPSAKEEEYKAYQKIEYKEDVIAKLWASGIIEKPNDLKLFEQANTVANLPTYQFNFKKCWLEPNNDNGLNSQLKILPKEKWLYTPIWSAISNLNKINNKEGVFKNALVIIRKDQLNSFDFTFLAKDIHFIVLDTNELQIENIGNSKQLFFNMKDEYDFKKIAENLKNNSIKYDAIIHASSIDNSHHLKDALSYSFYSLFLIHKYLLNVSHLKNMLLLTNDLAQITNEDTINPSNGTLVGAIRNINHEFLNIDARVIDIGSDKRDVGSFINQLMNDETYKKSEDLLAIRFGKLWKESFERIENPLPQVNHIEERDIILITGGLGGIALAIAHFISNKHKVTFILVSRNDIYKAANPSDYIKQKIKIIEEIKSNGSVVDIQNFDISDEQQVFELNEQIKNKYGNIHGVIHTAGVTPLTIDKYNLDNVKNAFKGKVYGINNIIKTLNLSNLRYIASTSSLANIMGDVNRIEYCASNSYLDYLSVDKVRLNNIKTITINTPGWSDIGMVQESPIEIGEEVKQRHGLHNLLHLNTVKSYEGAEIFYQLINQSNYNQVIVSKLDINELKNKLFVKEQTFTQDIHLTIKDENFTDTEFKIGQIWSQLLGVEELGVHDNFFELGGHSLLATRVISQIRKEFNIELPLRTIFENSSIIDLALIIDSNRVKADIKQINKTKEPNFEQTISGNNEDMVCEIEI